MAIRHRFIGTNRVMTTEEELCAIKVRDALSDKKIIISLYDIFALYKINSNLDLDDSNIEAWVSYINEIGFLKEVPDES